MRPKQLHFLFSGDQDNRSKIVLVFADTETKPSIVIKIPRTKQGERILKNEFENLSFAGSRLNKKDDLTIPTSIICDKFGQNYALIETAIPGQTLESKWGKLRLKHWLISVEADIPPVIEMLVTFQRKLSTNTSTVKLEAVFEEVWNGFTQLYTPSEQEFEKRNSIIESITEVSSIKLPRVWSHGDFWAGNIIQNNTHFALIDWEFATQNGLPYWDMFLFLTSIALYSPWAQFGRDIVAGFETTFSENSPLHSTFVRTICQYSEQLGFNADLHKVLFDIFLIDVATMRFRQFGLMSDYDRLFRSLITSTYHL